ncbi:hypothetical protein GALL_543940 [mine drainage metagenome]|uniref:Uncharacterized protein n=1 Tax=mine drainage metagenome TaxID=410659 RepID=A0A1J5P9A6_9ZZZZ
MNSMNCNLGNEIHCEEKLGSMSAAIAITNTGSAREVLTQKRLVISMRSGFSSSVALLRGSNAMPHIGQLPGSLRTTSRCIGQTYSVAFDFAGAGVIGSSAMPHLGHEPGIA